MLDSLPKLWIMREGNCAAKRCRREQEGHSVLKGLQEHLPEAGRGATRLLAAAVLTAGISASAEAVEEDLDFPMNPESTYSVTDMNQYACLRDGMIRAVYVEYSEVAGEPPCAVVYEKSSPEEASREIPWRAQADMGFCELHARELVEKLRNWGWKCGLFRDVLGIGD